jgi:2',3'-cyclic-nucleotide 2'-phosphodiesterase (5'-nucleotidase family)
MTSHPAHQTVGLFMKRLMILIGVALALACGVAAIQAQSVIGWNFGTGTANANYSSGTPNNFSVGSFGIGNPNGTVSSPINTSSTSSGYTGSSGSDNIGNAVFVGGLNTGSSSYYSVTFTPAAGYTIQITAFNFGMRSTSTGPQSYALYSSVDNYTTAIFTGTIANNSAWTFKTNPAFAVGSGSAVTLRLYTYGGSGNASSGSENNRMDDVAITVAANPVVASQVRVETAADGSGQVAPAQTDVLGNSITVYAISRDANNNFAGNVSGTWSLSGVTGSIMAGDLVASGDGKSATFTANHAGTAVIHVVSGGLTSTDSGTITVNALPTSPAAVGVAAPPAVATGSNVLLTVAVTPGANPVSTGLTVTGDLSALGGSSSQAFYDDGTHGDAVAGDNVFSVSVMVPTNTVGGSVTLPVTVLDGQNRSGTAAIALGVFGNLTIIHANDTHARVTPHEWIVPQHSSSPETQFEAAGGAAYLGGKILELTTNQPNALVLDGGDISEGNPVGDWNGPGTPVGTFGNDTTVEYFQMLDSKLRGIPGRGGRGLDAMVVGNHDIRDISYLNNLRSQTNFPVISINICSNGTLSPYFKPYVILNVNGNKIGVIGYTTESSDSPESAVNNIIAVAKCDWSSTATNKIHFADYVNALRITNGCNLVILLTHDGHSDLCTSSSGSTPILVDTAAAKLPEVAITGHWHTYCDSVWQPSVLNYKTIFTEEGSFMHYVGILQVNGAGSYLFNTNYPIRDSAITPDPDIANFIQNSVGEYNATTTDYQLDQVVGYTADDLLLDNKMKWWSSDEFPWSGNNTAGNWICDGVKWKATQLFGQCDVSMESGGGVRSDIPAGPVSYTQIYETYPWADDIIYEVNMTGQQIWNYIEAHGCDVGISSGWFITVHDGVPTSITVNGRPINLSQTYKVAINNYMYLHDTVPFTDPSPQTSTNLARSALVEYTAQFTQDNPYSAGGSRYSLDTEFSGGYRAVITMMNDADSQTSFDDAFIRFVSAVPETMGHLGTKQVPLSLVNSNGAFVSTNRLGEIELYRSYLGFRANALKPGDIIETWGKGSFYGGDPEFVDQEGIYGNGVEFNVVGHDASLALPAFEPNIATVLDDWHKNHYVQFLAKKTGASSVVDQQGTPLSVMDVTAYSPATLPGNTGDLLLITGVPTSESYSMRFRCGSAVLAATAGFSNYPPASVISPVSPYQQVAPVLHLSAQASLQTATKTTVTPVADSEVASGGVKAATNFGTSTSIYLQSSATDAYGNERGWYKFNLAGLAIPPGAVVTNVQLMLYCYQASGVADMPVEVHGSADDSWTETGITWNNQPALGPVLDTETLTEGIQNQYYAWNVTAFATNELAGDQVASFVAKPVAENAAATLSYGTDAREYSGGADAPRLEFDYGVTNANGAGVANVQFQYHYSPDGFTWTAWSAFATNSTAPYGADFNYPNGTGYYEFRTIATGTDGNGEPAPLLAGTAVYYTINYTNPPVAANYTMGCVRNSSNSIPVAKILKACSDPVGAALSITAVSPSGHSAVSLSNGTILYVPALNFAGPDSFNYTLQDSRGAVAVGTISVNVTIPAGSGPSVLSVTTSGGSATVNFAGIPGQSYDIEASSDLVNWVVIGSAVAGTNGLYNFTDASTALYSQRYYRSRVP